MADVIKSREWRLLRLQCFARDKQANAPCWICQGELGAIRYDLEPSSAPLAYEPDHFYSRSAHPELALVADNIRASHMVCNRKRGKKIAINMLGSTSRNW